jgi:hypothetical protein
MQATDNSVPTTPRRMKLVDALSAKLGYRPSPPTIWRWRKKGVNGVRLKAERCGRNWMTTSEDVDEFIRLQTQADNPPVQQQPVRTEAMIKQLRAAGLL